MLWALTNKAGFTHETHHRAHPSVRAWNTTPWVRELPLFHIHWVRNFLKMISNYWLRDIKLKTNILDCITNKLTKKTNHFNFKKHTLGPKNNPYGTPSNRSMWWSYRKRSPKKKILTVKILFEEKRLQKLKFLVQRQ